MITVFLFVLVSVHCDEPQPGNQDSAMEAPEGDWRDYTAQEAPEGHYDDGGDGSFEVPDEQWAASPRFRRPTECRWGMAVYGEREVMWSGCTKMTCMSWGWKYEPTKCCRYLDDAGNTARAFPGDGYYNGCNTAMCSEDGQEIVLTKRGCNDKCEYKNWDVVQGYAEVGSAQVQVYDENAFEDESFGCPKICACEATNGGPRISCRPGRFSCIYH